MPLRIDLIFVRDGQNDVVVVQVAGDLRADRLRIERRRRCCGSCCSGRIATAPTGTTTTSAATACGANTERHLHDRHGMSRLRVNARVGSANIEIDVFQILLPRGDEHLTTTLCVDEVHRRRDAARHPPIELTAVVVWSSTTSATAAGGRAVGRTAPSGRHACGTTRTAATATATAAAATTTATTTERCDDRRHVHSQLL